MCSTSNDNENNKNSDAVIRLQARAKTPPIEGKTRKPLLIDSSLDEYKDHDQPKTNATSPRPRHIHPPSLILLSSSCYNMSHH